MDLSQKEDDKLWYDTCNMVEHYWRTRGNKKPLIQEIHNELIELHKQIKSKDNSNLTMWHRNCNLETTIKENKDKISSMLKEKEELQSKITELEGKQNVEAIKIEQSFDRDETRHKFYTGNNRLWKKLGSW